MPLVHHFHGLRLLKASRARKPSYIETWPKDPALRDAYKIAAEHEGEFSRAWRAAVADLITPAVEKKMRAAWRDGGPMAAANVIPYYDTAPDDPMWKRFRERLSVAYLTVIQAAGDDAAKEMRKKFGVKLDFTALPPDGKEQIQKSMDDVREAAKDMTVAVNPYSIAWVNEQSLGLIKEGMSTQQRQVVTDILADAMENGVRPTEAIAQIKANIGLTSRDNLSVIARRQMHLDAGLAKDEAARLTGKYRDQLLTRRARLIARTETIRAQSQGRADAWKVAQDAGELPAVQRKWVSRFASPNPDAPCQDCLDMDGKTAPLGGTYDGPDGPCDGPPLHPNCSCAEVLERA